MRTGTTNSGANTTRRDWRDLKPGDVIRFATGWYEVLDAYPIARDTVLVKLAITPGNRGAPGTPGRIETHRVRVAAGSRATCLAWGLTNDHQATENAMRITRIDLEGKPGFYATLRRPRGSQHIRVTLLTPDLPDGRDHHVQADCQDDLWSMAECLQEHLDGHRGTNSMIHDYLRELQRLAD